MEVEQKIRKRKEINDIRKIKIIELYTKEKENYEFELATKDHRDKFSNSFNRERSRNFKPNDDNKIENPNKHESIQDFVRIY